MQAQDTGDCLSSRDLGAEPGGRRRGSAQPRAALGELEWSRRQGGGPTVVCLHPGLTETMQCLVNYDQVNLTQGCSLPQ